MVRSTPSLGGMYLRIHFTHQIQESQKTPLEYGKPFTKRYKIMTVAYPRKFKKTMSARDIMKRVISDREIHLVTLNRYRY
ncbi:MAG: DUF455 domain-containing protein, partial [Microcystis sp.]